MRRIYLFLIATICMFLNLSSIARADTFQITNYYLSGWENAYAGTTIRCAAVVTVVNNIPSSQRQNYYYQFSLNNNGYSSVYASYSTVKFSYFGANETANLKIRLINSNGTIVYDEVSLQVTSDDTCGPPSIPPPDPPDPPDDGGNEPPAGGNLPPTKDWGAVDDSKPANACGGGRWTSPIRNWVDNIFCPIITFLDLARAKLAAVSLMMGQGLNIGKYFKIFGDLPTSWQLVVSSLLLMVATLGALLIFRSAMRIYYSIKEGVKWW